MIRVYLVSVILALTACSPAKKEITGIWRGVIEMQNEELPFVFEIIQAGDTYHAIIRNSTERLTLDELSLVNDSLTMKLHIFDAQLKARIVDNKLEGLFIKNYDLSATLPFRAVKGENFRFIKEAPTTHDFSGKYSVTFTTQTDTIPAVGIFEQQGNKVTGTFLTPTGDYRYLEGNVVDDELKLSTFDGNHAFIFNARMQHDTLHGKFLSGKNYVEQWIGIRNENATLPNPESLTYLKSGYDKIEFSFPSFTGGILSPQDEAYKNKVLVLQIFGTWCPNCMDETRFLAEWYAQHKNRGVEIIGLAYERKNDFDYASVRIKKMKEKISISYPFVFAGTSDKLEAAKTLPMLNHILAFPTTIFIGKDGYVKKIHTGFSGPGTGIYYQQFKESFNNTINELLKATPAAE
jgi:thiol-disulfide isomerase/thioredoxin